MRSATEMQPPDETPIERLDASARTYFCLKRAHVTNVSQILAKDKVSLMNILRFRNENFYELREKLIMGGFMSPDRPLGPFADEGIES